VLGGVTLLLPMLVATIGLGASPASAYPVAPWFRAASPYRDNFPDPFVLKDGDTYYAYATPTGGPLLPVMSSTDLVTWTARPAYNPNPYNSDPYLNDALPHIPTWAKVEWNEGWRNASTVWAPAVAKFGATYVAFITFHCPVGNGWVDCIGTASSSSPMGPFVPDNSGPIVRDDAAGGIIDASPFIDPNTGIGYLVWRTNGIPGSQPSRFWTRQLSGDGRSFAPGSSSHFLLQTTEGGWQGNLIEGPHMVRFNGRIYLFYSANNWYSKDYAIGYAMCDSPTGPCVDINGFWNYPFLASRTSRIGPGGPTPFVDGGNLRLAYHAWNAPYVNYPTYDDSFSFVPCTEPTVSTPIACRWQGQRRMHVDTVTQNGDGTLNPPALDMGAPQAPVADRRFHAITPFRVLDTRNLSTGMGTYHAVKPEARWVVPIEVMGRGRGAADGTDRIPAGGVSAVVMNITAAEGEDYGYVSAYPCGGPLPVPESPLATSNLNYRPGSTVPNLVVSQLGTDGKVCLFTEKRAQIIADVVGYYDSAGSSSSFTPLPPTRVLDSRPGAEQLAWTSKIGPGETRNLTVSPAGGVPAGATAVVMNVTAVAPSAGADLRVWPAGKPVPDASNLNVSPGQVVPNLVVSAIGAGGQVSIRNSSGTMDVLADVVGYFSSSGSTFSSLSPSRILDTRIGLGAPQTPVGPGGVASFAVRQVGGVPANATAAILNVTAVNATNASHLTIFPSDLGVAPNASNLNFGPLTGPIANLVMVPIGADGAVKVRNNSGSVNVIADVVGYYVSSG